MITHKQPYINKLAFSLYTIDKSILYKCISLFYQLKLISFNLSSDQSLQVLFYIIVMVRPDQQTSTIVQV